MATIDPIQATFLVATDGNDEWSGKLPEPNAGRTDGPFATLRRARDAVRELKKAQDGLGEPVTIPTAAAIANAVYHATGVRVTSTPITPAQLCLKLAEQQREG